MKHDKWLVWSQHKNTNGSVGQSNHSDDMIYSGRNYWSVTPEHLNRFCFKLLDKKDLMDP
jgi:hypothetical protein